MKKANALTLFFVLILFQTLFVGLYVATERTFMFWDQSMYHAFVRELLAAPSFSDGARLFLGSFSRNYNLLYAFPSALGMSLFGESRGVFILSQFLVYFVPLEIAAAFLARRLFAMRLGTALSLTLLASFAVIPLWSPLLEGFPDCASAALFAFACLLFLSKPASVKKAVFLGLLLGLAVVLRRHFAYAAIAFFLAAGIEGLFQRKALPSLIKELGGAALVMAALICAMEPAYVQQVLTTSFRELYKSYEEPFSTFLVYLASIFGLPTLFLATGAMLFAAKKGPRPSDARFLLLFAALWILLWGLGPGQLGAHHLMPILPLFTLLGCVGFLVQTWKIKALFVPGAAFLAAQALWCLWVAPSQIYVKAPTPPSFFAETHPPLRRGDYDALIDLARDLLHLTTPQDRIVVVGSSALLNQDLLRAVIIEELRRPDLLQRFLWAPEIDNNQAPPFDVVAGGTFFLVPTPTQYHLNPEGQKVVTALAQQFPPMGGLARFFSKEDKLYRLDQGVEIALWRRQGWTPQSLHEALSRVRVIAGGTQRWVAPETAYQPIFQPDGTGQTNAYLPFGIDKPRETLLLDASLSVGSYRLGMLMVGGPGCNLPALLLKQLRPDGTKIAEERVAPLTLPSPLFRLFEVTEPETYLSLQIEAQPTAPCGLILQGLRVERAGG